MDTILKVVRPGVTSVSVLGKEFVADEDGKIVVAEEDNNCLSGLLASGVVKYAEDVEAEEEAAAAKRKADYEAAVDAAARQQLADEEFQARVEARALELLAADATTEEEKEALKKAVDTVNTTRQSAKKR
jgi:hypothetical protein